jgi:dCMP deaminase
MPSGWTNECEVLISEELKTKDEVIHAEANAIAKLAKGPESGQDSTMFLTHSPCIHCAKQIYTAGVKTVYYENNYRLDNGITFLKQCGVEVVKYKNND